MAGDSRGGKAAGSQFAGKRRDPRCVQITDAVRPAARFEGVHRADVASRRRRLHGWELGVLPQQPELFPPYPRVALVAALTELQLPLRRHLFGLLASSRAGRSSDLLTGVWAPITQHQVFAVAVLHNVDRELFAHTCSSVVSRKNERGSTEVHVTQHLCVRQSPAAFNVARVRACLSSWSVRLRPRTFPRPEADLECSTPVTQAKCVDGHRRTACEHLLYDSRPARGRRTTSMRWRRSIECVKASTCSAATAATAGRERVERRFAQARQLLMSWRPLSNSIPRFFHADLDRPRSHCSRRNGVPASY